MNMFDMWLRRILEMTEGLVWNVIMNMSTISAIYYKQTDRDEHNEEKLRF